jgi:hypothetical protein
MSLWVKSLTGQVIRIDCNHSSTTIAIKQALTVWAKKHGQHWPVERQQLICPIRDDSSANAESWADQPTIDQDKPPLKPARQDPNCDISSFLKVTNGDNRLRNDKTLVSYGVKNHSWLWLLIDDPSVRLNREISTTNSQALSLGIVDARNHSIDSFPFLFEKI